MPDANENETHGDVILTEDGYLFVVYRVHPDHSATGLVVTDGDQSCESIVDFCVAGDFATDDQVRGDRARIERILSAERDGLSSSYSDAKSRNDVEMMEAYRHDMDSLDDAARIIIGRFGY